MEIYILSGLYSIFFAWLAEKNSPRYIRPLTDTKSKYRKISYILFAVFSFLPLFLISALRYGITFDYLYTYVPSYYQIAAGQKSYFEIGFVLLNKLVFYIFNNVDWLFIITSFIFLIFMFSVIFSRSVSIYLSVFLLLGTRMYYISFGQIRQYIVIAVFLFSLKYIEQGNLVKYSLIILAASCIHTLALAYIPIYFLCRVHLSKKTYIITGLTFFAVTPLLHIVYLFLAQNFYRNYVSTGFGSDHSSQVEILLTLFVFLMTILYYDRIPQTRYTTILINLQLIAAVISITTLGIPESYRLLALFMYSSILLIPLIINLERNKFMHLFLLGANILIFSAAAIVCIVNNGYLLPYTTIFSN